LTTLQVWINTELFQYSWLWQNWSTS